MKLTHAGNGASFVDGLVTALACAKQAEYYIEATYLVFSSVHDLPVSSVQDNLLFSNVSGAVSENM